MGEGERPMEARPPEELAALIQHEASAKPDVMKALQSRVTGGTEEIPGAAGEALEVLLKLAEDGDSGAQGQLDQLRIDTSDTIDS